MTELKDLSNKFKKSTCRCSRCRHACRETRPCVGTPEEIDKIINAGYSDKLMLDWRTKNESTEFHVIAPAIIGYECKKAPFIPSGRCSFFNSDELCDLHELDLKPLGGQLASCNDSDDDCTEICRIIMCTWDTNAGRQTAARWITAHFASLCGREIVS